MKIRDSDISVIIHGPLSHSPDMPVEKCLVNTRMLYPNSQIIVATWRGEDISRVSGVADSVICLDRIKAPCDVFGRQKLNINAMLATVQSALESCKRNYVLKLRSDICPINDNFTNKLGEIDKGTRHGLFKKRIRVSNFYTRNPVRVPMLYHIGDIVHFGALEDMKQLWGRELLQHKWLQTENMTPDRRLLGDWFFTTTFRVVPEQALVLSWLARSGYDINFKNICQNTFKNFCLWEEVLKANFDVVNHENTGILYPKRFFSDGYGESTLHTEQSIKSIRNKNTFCFVLLRYAFSLVNQYIFCVFKLSWIRAAACKVLDIYCPWIKKIIAMQ